MLRTWHTFWEQEHYLSYIEPKSEHKMNRKLGTSVLYTVHCPIGSVQSGCYNEVCFVWDYKDPPIKWQILNAIIWNNQQFPRKCENTFSFIMIFWNVFFSFFFQLYFRKLENLLKDAIVFQFSLFHRSFKPKWKWNHECFGIMNLNIERHIILNFGWLYTMLSVCIYLNYRRSLIISWFMMHMVIFFFIHSFVGLQVCWLFFRTFSVGLLICSAPS